MVCIYCNLYIDMKIKQTIIAVAMAFTIGGNIIYYFSPGVSAAKCGGIETSVIDCDGTEVTSEIKETGLWQLLILAIDILTAGVGILAVAGVIYGSVLYASSGGNAERTKKAKDILFNVILGIVAYALMYSFVNWLIPGGVFN